jgi:glycosidase
VATQDGDPSSVLNTYRRLLWLRRRHPALQVGAYRQLPSPSGDVFAFERSTDAETIIVAVNFSAEPRSLRIRTAKRWKTLFDTHEPAQAALVGGDELTLRPYEAVIISAA